MIVSNIRPPSSSSIPYGFKNTRVTKRETAELCNQPTDYTFPVMMIPVDITRGSLPDGTQHTHDDDDDDVLYMSTHIHTGAMTCSSFSRNFLLSNELYNHSIGGHIYSISYSLLMAVCVCTFFFLVNVTRNVCWF